MEYEYYRYSKETASTLPCVDPSRETGNDDAIVLDGASDEQGEMFAEALNVFRGTGMTPRQLAEQSSELLWALKEMVEFFQPNAWGSDENKVDALENARAALAWLSLLWVRCLAGSEI